jgi:hypothetical protein
VHIPKLYAGNPRFEACEMNPERIFDQRSRRKVIILESLDLQPSIIIGTTLKRGR